MKNWKSLLIKIIVAVCSVIASFFATSCSTIWIKGEGNATTVEQDAAPITSLNHSSDTVATSVLNPY